MTATERPLESVLDELFARRYHRLQATVARQRQALRRLQDKRGVRIVGADRIEFDAQEWVPAEVADTARERANKTSESIRTFLADLHQTKSDAEHYKMMERALNTADVGDHYSTSGSPMWKLDALIRQHRALATSAAEQRLASYQVVDREALQRDLPS